MLALSLRRVWINDLNSAFGWHVPFLKLNKHNFEVSLPRCVYSTRNHKVCIKQSEHNYISNKWYIKYQQYQQLHVSASMLTIVRLYSTYQVIIQYACFTLGGTRSRPPPHRVHHAYCIITWWVEYNLTIVNIEAETCNFWYCWYFTYHLLLI